MLGIKRRHWVKGLIALVSAVVLTSLALEYFIPVPPSKISIGTSSYGGAYELFANQYREILKRSNLDLDVRLSEGGRANLKMLQDQDSDLQVGFVQTGNALGLEQPGVLSLGRINHQTFWIFYKSTETLDDLTQFKGKRIATGTLFSNTLIERMLASAGVTPENSTVLRIVGEPAFQALKAGKIDIGFFPSSSVSPLIDRLLHDPDIKLLNLETSDAVTRIFPSIVKLVLPRGAIDLAHHIPASDVQLVATTNSVLVRRDLHPATVRLLAQALVKTHGGGGLFQKPGEFPTLTDDEYTMSADAVDYYKNGSPILERYLPARMVPYFQRFLAVLLAALAVVYPVYSLAPGLMKSFIEWRLSGTYRRLREIDASLHDDSTAPQVDALDAELSDIGREIAKFGIPNRNSEMYFSIKTNLQYVQDRVKARRVELGKVGVSAG